MGVAVGNPEARRSRTSRDCSFVVNATVAEVGHLDAGFDEMLALRVGDDLIRRPVLFGALEISLCAAAGKSVLHDDALGVVHAHGRRNVPSQQEVELADQLGRDDPAVRYADEVFRNSKFVATSGRLKPPTP
jgi:hypothetical protein